MQYVIFLIGYCTLLFHLYPKVSALLEKNTPLFENSNRQNYIVKNVIKSCSLCVLVLLSFIYLTEWDNLNIKIFASMYVSNDMIGMVKCEQLPTSTRVHHTTTSIFLIGAYMTDFTTSHIGKMLFYFTYASALAFPVNAYLGLRLCYDRESYPRWLKHLKEISKYVYAAVCSVNWSFQAFHLNYTYDEIIYCFLIGLIIIDDLVLMRWLFKN